MLSILSFIVFFFILPRYNHTNTTILSIVGSIIFVYTTLLATFSNRSWRKDRIEESLKRSRGDNNNGILFVISIFPILIFYFIFSWHFGKVSKDILKNTQIETIATVVSGSSFTTNKLDFSEIKLTFTTKKGKEILATKKMYDYEFKKYYKGQKIKIIYASENPQIIELMNTSHRIKKYKNSEERSTNPGDLIKTFGLSKEQIVDYLNKITYGWEYNTLNSQWRNAQNGLAFTKKGKEITYLTNKLSMRVFSKYFLKKGYKEETKGTRMSDMTQQERRFQNEKYIAIIKRIKFKDKVYYLTKIIEK